LPSGGLAVAVPLVAGIPGNPLPPDTPDQVKLVSLKEGGLRGRQAKVFKVQGVKFLPHNRHYMDVAVGGVVVVLGSDPGDFWVKPNKGT